jgi:hypothetical protein
VLTKCVANTYAGPAERIIEFSFPNGLGGLISLRYGSAGSCTVDVYQVDQGIAVLGARSSDEPRRASS